MFTLPSRLYLRRCQHFCRYTETVPKTSLVCINVQSWDQQDIFIGEPMRGLVLAMTTNAGFLVAERTNSLLPKVWVGQYHCFSVTVAGSPLITDRQKSSFEFSGSSCVGASWSWHSLFRIFISIFDDVWSYKYSAGITRLPTSRFFKRCVFNQFAVYRLLWLIIRHFFPLEKKQ